MLLALGAVLVLLVLVSMAHVATLDVASLARRNPGTTALMRERADEAREQGRPYRVDQRWVRYDLISPELRRAVLIAEDDAFYSHDGLDWNEIRASARVNLQHLRVVRGGSTITQQLAKNLWLGSGRTATRKLEEMMLAMRLEHTLSKRRIFELYLNSIEWGDGVFGIEAAARRTFGVSAADLDARKAVRLAAVIINPRLYSPSHPSRRIERRMAIIASRMRRRGFLSDAEYASVVGREAPPPEPGFFDWFFGGIRDTEATVAPDSSALTDTTAMR